MRHLQARIIARLPRARVALLAMAALALLTAASTCNNPVASPSGGSVSAPFTSAAFTFGVENSWIRVQNVGQSAATVTVTYYNEQGSQLAQDACPSAACPALGPGQGWTFFQQNNPSLPPGYKGSALVESDQPVVALQAKDIRRNGKFMIDGNTTTIASGSSRMYLPLVANRDGAQSDSMGRFAIQNLSDSATACVGITYLSNYTDSEIAWDPYKPGTSGTSPLAGCPKGGRPLPPRGTLFRDPDTFGVPPKFTGSVRIETYDNAAGVPASQQKLTATADSWNTIYNLFASYRALDESEMSTTVLLPLVDRQVGPLNGFSTRFQIENKDPSRPAQVTLRFEGFDLNHGNAFVARQNTITVNGARLCFQDRNDYANCLAPGDALPPNFVGTARLTSTQPIGVIVDRGTDFGETFTNYRGFRPQDGATRVLLPVLNKNYGPVPPARGWNSWFRILVADGGSANVTIRYLGLDLPGGEQSYTIPVNREATVFQFNEPFLPDGFAGTAILQSDRPIVALADIYTDVFSGDDDLLYNGVPLP
ncbi:MAG TPA: hypothetical protein VEZ14_02540 [Dehalococcoidia bacterium]|nr:hypothetical protein [Dehalococcoidia bacterium]